MDGHLVVRGPIRTTSLETYRDEEGRKGLVVPYENENQGVYSTVFGLETDKSFTSWRQHRVYLDPGIEVHRLGPEGQLVMRRPLRGSDIQVQATDDISKNELAQVQLLCRS